ncbi:SapC family protein [Salinisphaera aquimarina]|uniref:SapC family protein n=1 Tax=Salinisphaera aquimarina TaxID=2094031 RepID=A0ABV7EPA5_9GAMM
MFKQLEILSAEQHGHLKLTAVEDFRFTAELSQAPIVFDEIVEAAKHFPIVFPTGAQIRPVVLLGLNRGRNSFVADDGRWRAGYVPAYLRRYPFVFGHSPGGGSERLTVMLDRKAPHLDAVDGRPLFDKPDQGKDGERPVMGRVVHDAVAFLTRYQEAADAIAQQMAPLVEQDVLVERDLEMYMGRRRANRITGMRVIDRERVMALDDDILARWSRDGLLEIVHAHWQSLTNFKRLTG